MLRYVVNSSIHVTAVTNTIVVGVGECTGCAAVDLGFGFAVCLLVIGC